MHTHFEVDRHVPRRIDVTPDGGGPHDERAVLDRTVEPDRLDVMDRGYAKFALFNPIVATKSSYVCRVRDNSVSRTIEDRPVCAAAAAEGVTGDAVVDLGSPSSEKLAHRVRPVTVAAEPHAKRTGATAPGCDGTLRIATNLLDVPAEIVALLYRHRWAIEKNQADYPSRRRWVGTHRPEEPHVRHHPAPRAPPRLTPTSAPTNAPPPVWAHLPADRRKQLLELLGQLLARLHAARNRKGAGHE